MINEKLIWFTMVFYLIGFLFYVIYIINKGSSSAKKIALTATIITWIGLFLHVLAFSFRWIETYKLGYGHIPLTNMYESMLIFSLAIILLYLIMQVKYKFPSIGAIATLLAVIALGIMSLTHISASAKINPLEPALQSNWLTAHVLSCFLGYAAFALGFGVSALYLIKNFFPNNNILNDVFPPLSVIDELNYKAIATGFPMLTIGIFTGAVWANYSWGSYWNWDPKETWSLITWFVYALFLHLRLTKGWRGKNSAILSLIGFLFVIFTYYGVNYLITGLHSYA